MWKAPINQILFPLRQILPKFRRKPYREFYAGPTLSQSYLPRELSEQMKARSLRDCLFYSWIFEQLQLPRWEAPICALDIGSKNFFYAPGLYLALKKQAPSVHLTGLEIDGGRLYADGYRRKDYGQYYAKIVNDFESNQNVTYRNADWLKEPPKTYDFASCFFPFLFDDLHEAWGLPQQSFDPLAFYKKLFCEASNVLLFHQGQEEKKASLHLISKIDQQPSLVDEKTFRENPYVERKKDLVALVFKAYPQALEPNLSTG